MLYIFVGLTFLENNVKTYSTNTLGSSLMPCVRFVIHKVSCFFELEPDQRIPEGLSAGLSHIFQVMSTPD